MSWEKPKDGKKTELNGIQWVWKSEGSEFGVRLENLGKESGVGRFICEGYSDS